MSNTKIKASQFHGVVGHGTDGYFLMTNADGSMSWSQASTGPSVTSVTYPGDDTAADPAGGQTVVLTGTGFATSGMTVTIGGTTAPSVAHDSNTQLTITTPAKAAGDYDIVVTNGVTGASGTFVNGISYNGVPTWTTAAGSLGTFESETTISTITLQATEPDGGTITFNITNGALPTGLSLTGANINGTTTAESSTTLYSFTIEAIDDENQATPRNFSITVNAAELVSSENFTINTYTGTGSTQSIEGKIGTAAEFNGSSSYIDTGSNFNLANNSFSFSFWMANTKTSLDTFGDSVAIGNMTNITSNQTIGIGRSGGQGGKIFFSTYGNDITGNTVASTDGSTFQHIVATFDSSNNSMKLYVDGQLEGSHTASSNFTGTSNIIIGNWSALRSDDYFQGKIDQVRIFNKALSSSEVTTLYGESNTSTTKSTTDIFADGSGVALYEFEKGAIDTGGVTGYIGSGGMFDGSSSYIDINSITFPSNNFTVSAWVNTADVSAQYNMIIVPAKNGSGTMYLTLEYNKLYYYDSGLAVSLASNAGTISNNTWYHCVITKSSVDGIKLYLNGSLVDSNSGTTSLNTSNSGENRIGHYYTPTSLGYFNGKIDQVRIFNKALSSSEVTTLYGETSASSTKSTTDIFNDGSGVALYELEGNANASDRIELSHTISTIGSDNNSGGMCYDGTDIIWLGDVSDNAYAINTSTDAISTKFTGLQASLYGIAFDGTYYYYTNRSDKTVRKIDSSGVQQASYSIASLMGNYQPIGIAYENGNFYVSTDQNSTIYKFNSTFSSVSATLGSVGSYTNVGCDAYNGYLYVISRNGTNSEIVLIELSGFTKVKTIDLDAIDSRITNPQGMAIDYDNNKMYINDINDDVSYVFNIITSQTEFSPQSWGPSTTATNVSYAYDGTPTNVGFVGTSFQPDLVWIKARDGVASHPIADSVRGEWKTLYANATAAEQDQTTNQIHGITSFNSNGFTVKDDNNGNYGLNGAVGTTYGGRYVAWCWKAASSDSTNTDGSITSTVRANQDAGFSIVKYTSSSSPEGDTIGHGLSSTPELIIVKATTAAESWVVYHKDLPFGYQDGLSLNTTNASLASADNLFWYSAPTTLLFSTGRWHTANATNIAYCFHSVSGYQKVGSYTGGSSGSGSVITTGFKPRFLLVKCTSAAGDDWIMLDSTRGGGDTFQNHLRANTSEVESTFNRQVTFVSNGFYWGQTDAAVNGSSRTYIYLAIA